MFPLVLTINTIAGNLHLTPVITVIIIFGSPDPGKDLRVLAIRRGRTLIGRQPSHLPYTVSDHRGSEVSPSWRHHGWWVAEIADPLVHGPLSLLQLIHDRFFSAVIFAPSVAAIRSWRETVRW